MALLLMGGCLPLPAAKGRLSAEEMREAVLGQGERKTAPPTSQSGVERSGGWQLSTRLTALSRQRELLPEASVVAKPAGRSPRRISVQVVATPARAFFEGLVSQDPTLNMIVHPEVEAAISVELKEVTVDEAVAIVCEMYQLDCQPFGDKGQGGPRGYKIFPWQLTTRTYPVDFLPVVRDGYSQTVVSSGEKQTVTTTRISKDKSSTTATPSMPGTGMRTEYKSDFWQDLENTITAILQLGLTLSKVTEETDSQGKTTRNITRERSDLPRPSRTLTSKRVKKKAGELLITTEREHIPAEQPEEGSPDEDTSGSGSPPEKGLVVNRQAGLITVRAYPLEHQEIARFLEQLRSRSQRQVILEAKILEVELNDGAQFGIDWLAVHRGIGKDSMPPLTGEPNGASTFISQPWRVGNDPTTAPITFITQAVNLSRSAGVDQPFNLAMRAHDFVGFVHLLQQQGKVHVLSSPRIATVNNQKAVIKVGSDEFFVTGVNPGTVVGSGSDRVVNPSTIAIESMFTGISLDVTPQIGAGEMITLHIHPLVTEVQDKMKHFTIDDKPQSLPLAFTQTRETDSIVRVHNGEVAVIGGLMKNRTKEQTDRLPVLGDIPVLGALFGSETKRWEKSELVILLRPVVVDGSQDWDGQVVRAADRIQGMAQGMP
ncbi:MAG: pilus (MSHA type) biogenesis protein MshL [Magnetococcales bacterium]|nr:pilus (MSHA type) biogenesis protein MshL [Magnetococcales bacterium]